MSRLAVPRRATLGALLAATCALLLALAPGARAAGTVDVYSSPAGESRPMTITVSGTTDTATRLFLLVRSAGTCAARYADNTGPGVYEIFLTSGIENPGTALSVGGYSQGYTFWPPHATTYRVCAYLAQSLSVPTEAMGEDTFTADPMPAYATVTVAAGATEGKPVSVAVAGSVWMMRRLYVTATEGACPYEVVPTTADFAIAQTVTLDYRTTFTLDGLQAKTYHFCAYIYNPDDPSPAILLRDAAAAVAALPAAPAGPVTPTPTPAPIAVPGPAAVTVPATGAPAGTITDRRPTFSWSTAAGYDDTFTLTDGRGAVLLLVTSKGAFVPMGGDGAETVADAAGYLGATASRSAAAAAPKGYEALVKQAVTYAVAGTTASVRLKAALPPGGYRWSVSRVRTDGATATSTPAAFTIAGPKLTRLAVKTAARPLSDSARPGSTLLRITTTPYAHVSLTLRKGGHQRVLNLRWGAAATATVPVDWSCTPAGGAYNYTVTASDDGGATRTAKGTFRTIAQAHCQSLKAAEKRASQQRAAQRRHEQAATRRALQQRIDRCHALPGTAQRVTWPDGATSLICATATGISTI
jgi:hypothetical protein